MDIFHQVVGKLSQSSLPSIPAKKIGFFFKLLSDMELLATASEIEPESLINLIHIFLQFPFHEHICPSLFESQFAWCLIRQHQFHPNLNIIEKIMGFYNPYGQKYFIYKINSFRPFKIYPDEMSFIQK